MGEHLWWDDETVAYLGSRSRRYPGAIDVFPSVAQEALDDPDVAVLDPDPKSRMGAARFIGWSETARRVVTVIAYRDLDGDLHLINAWIATGADMKVYSEGATWPHR